MNVGSLVFLIASHTDFLPCNLSSTKSQYFFLQFLDISCQTRIFCTMQLIMSLSFSCFLIIQIKRGSNTFHDTCCRQKIIILSIFIIFIILIPFILLKTLTCSILLLQNMVLSIAEKVTSYLFTEKFPRSNTYYVFLSFCFKLSVCLRYTGTRRVQFNV